MRGETSWPKLLPMNAFPSSIQCPIGSLPHEYNSVPNYVKAIAFALRQRPWRIRVNLHEPRKVANGALHAGLLRTTSMSRRGRGRGGGRAPLRLPPASSAARTWVFQMNLIPRERRRADLNDAVQREAELLIETSKPLPIRNAIQTQVFASQALRAAAGVGKQRTRKAPLGPCTAYGKFVDECGCARRDFGPEVRVFEFKLHDAGDGVTLAGDMEESLAHVSKYAFFADLRCPPKG